MAGLQECHQLTWGCFESMRFICKDQVLMLDFVFAQIQPSLLWHLKDSELLQKQAKKSQSCSLPLLYSIPESCLSAALTCSCARGLFKICAEVAATSSIFHFLREQYTKDHPHDSHQQLMSLGR
jgi:hypothetical protein